MTASSSPSTPRAGDWALEPKDIYLALAAEVPKDGELVANPNKTWKEVNPALPDWPIVAYIPGEKHGTREVFEEKVLARRLQGAGADKLDLAKAEGADDAAKKKAADKACDEGPQGRRCCRHRRRLHRDARPPHSPTRRAWACSVCRSTRTTPTS